MNEEEIAARLFAACKASDLATLQQVLAESSYAADLLRDTNVPDKGKAIGEKTIVAAALSGNVEVMTVLLKENANVNVSTAQGSPIYAAAKNGHMAVVNLLLQWGAEFRHIKAGFSPVFAACLEGHLNILKVLVKKGGVGVLGVHNPPLVVTACSRGHLEVLDYLIQNTNFDIHRTFRGKDVVKEEKDSLLYIACSRGKPAIANYLITKGALITKGISAKYPKMLLDALLQKVKEVEEIGQLAKQVGTTMEAAWSGLQLLHLPSELVPSLPASLTAIDLSQGVLESLPEELFALPNLRTLKLNKNRLSELTSEDFQWTCLNLRELEVNRNQLVSLPSSLFTLPELTTVSVSYNLLSALPGDCTIGSHAVWNCEKLRKLDVSHNHFRSLPDCFQSLKNLKNLKISYNRIGELPLSLCWGSVCLVSLDASHNELTDLPLGAANFWMLSMESLYLAHNSIEDISTNITELTRLNTLNLAHNKISSLPLTTCWSCDRLSRLDLSYNSLSVLSHAAPLDASLGQPDDKAGKKKGITKVPKPVQVVPEMELPYKKWERCLQVLVLSNNKLQWLPDYVGLLSSLTKLDLSNNLMKDLPLQLGFLKNCWELNLNGLNLAKIPPHLKPGSERKGVTKQLLAYLRAQKRNCRPYNRMKLMVVGLQGRGKTTMLSALRDRSAPLPDNISTVGVALNTWTCPMPPKSRRVSTAHPVDNAGPVVFSTWDLAGQEVYYATHQCFLSRNTLYLAAWNMKGGENEIKALRPWLLNIQARAPHSPVIIVGTHFDKLPAGEAPELRGRYRQLLERIYKQPGGGYPEICDIIEVSAVTKEGFPALNEAIYRAAVNAKDPDTREKVIGQQVPSSYLGLQRVLEQEVAHRKEKGSPPVLTQQEFTKLTDKIPENDILDDEDLALAAQFLHDNGVLLHYNDHLRGLNNLYFIDPAWLCDMLAEVIAVPERTSFARNGTLAEANVAFLFRDTKKFPPEYLGQYLQLLERFEIALSLGDGTRLIPSMLAVKAPAFNFAPPPPPHYKPLSAEDIGPPVCMKRRYLMVYVPSGFWSRLITRIMINLKRTGLVDPTHRRCYGDAVYWRRGIFIGFNGGKFLATAIEQQPSSMKDCLASLNKVADGVPENDDLQGVELTVWSNDGEDFSAVGYLVDQVESLIDEWFPGLKNTDAMGHVLFEREAVWVVPPHLCKNGPSRSTEEGQPPLQPETDEEEEVAFKLEDCALRARKASTIYNAAYDVKVPLVHLVPELLLTDLPEDLKMSTDVLEYNPEDFGTLLGVGGAGAVYRGRYNGKPVAIKRFLTVSEAERIYEQLEYGTSRRSSPPAVTSVEALQLFKDVRQEVTVLSCLDSPYVVKLLGVCLDPLFMATELAPQGSLYSLLEKKREAIQTQQGDLSVTQIPKMPGGVLGYEVTTRISLQVAIALSYLHDQGVVYRDLKGDNVLVWSIDPTHKINVKLADYGISRFATPGGVKGEEGTPGYMAPEALKKRGEDQSFDEKVDIFAYAMFLYELLTGVRTFEEVENVSEINRLVLRGERPRILEYNAELAFPSINELMFDCWKQTAADRPSANEIISRLIEPGFLCRKHCITNVNGLSVPQVFEVYAIPRQDSEDQPNSSFNSVWMWSKKDTEHNFSILNASRGVFAVLEKTSGGGRVYCMTSTGEINKRLWVGTADHEIHVFEQGPNVVDSRMLWTYSLRRGDSVLDLTTEVTRGRVTRVFAGLANGSVLVFSRQSITGEVPEKIGGAVKRPDLTSVVCKDEEFEQEAREWLDPQVLPVSESRKPPNCLQIVQTNFLWCGCGNTIVVVDIRKMEKVRDFGVFTNNFHLVYQLMTLDDRVWVRGRQLPLVIEYNATTFEPVWKINCEEIDPTGKFVYETYTQEVDRIEEIPFPDHPSRFAADSEGGREFVVEDHPNFLRPGGRGLTMTGGSQSLRPRRQRLGSIVVNLPNIRKRHRGGTRVTSCVLVRDCLWIGRGMGDILVVDISKSETSGRVLARLALDDTEAYGNKSTQLLVLVNDEYVVSTQNLVPHSKSQGSGDSGSRQQITVWKAWSKETIQQYNHRIKAVLNCGGVLLKTS